MKIESTRFIKSIVSDDAIMEDGIPQIAFVGRSNVGKSSLINSLTGTELSRTSSFPGRTAQINFFLVNDSVYFVDLPGYGFAKTSGAKREEMSNLISTYLFNRVYKQKKIVLIIDANVGMTKQDVEMFEELQAHKKDFIIALSKVDKLSQSEAHHNIVAIKKITGDTELFEFSSKTKKGIDKLVEAVLA